MKISDILACMGNSETPEVLVGWGVSLILYSLTLLDLVLGRKMFMVHGTRAQRPAGLIRAIFALLRMYWFGYSNTLFVNPDCKVKTRTDEREMRKNRRSKSVMIFEVEL